jgi:serine phosphatase RsbU (regulator of sigma subunit)
VKNTASPKKFILPAAVLALASLCLLVVGQTGEIAEFMWEDPEYFSPGTFPVQAGNETLQALAWQETGGGSIMVSAAVKDGRAAWAVRRAIAGPYTFTGAEPAILSITVDKPGNILIAVGAQDHFEVVISRDRGRTFEAHRIAAGGLEFVAPRISAMDSGGYLLFASREEEDDISVYYARSEDGVEFSQFEPFIRDSLLNLNFLPTHISRGAKDFVVFQSYQGLREPAYQLFFSSSLDGGRSWSVPRALTILDESRRVDNQRPHLSVQQGRLFLVWERRVTGNFTQIYCCFLDDSGRITGNIEQVSSGGGACYFPIGFDYLGAPAVTWFDNRLGQSRAYIARRTSLAWQNDDVSGNLGGEAIFVRPAPSLDGLFVFWQQQNRSRIMLLKPDTTVAAPSLAGQNFRSGAPSGDEVARITWNAPRDSSGIAGFSYTWSRDRAAEPPLTVTASNSVNSAAQTAAEDGPWYFAIKTQDFAGNWSATSRIEFIRDRTPPGPVVLEAPPVDGAGYLLSNNFTFAWTPPEDEDLGGYTWLLEFLGSGEQYARLDTQDFAETAVSLAEEAGERLPLRVMGTANTVTYPDQESGLWRFSVAAIDGVGNIGPASRLVFRANKYLPRTLVTWAGATADGRGGLAMRLVGRGFREGGDIERIVLRSGTGQEHSYPRERFNIPSDREIAGLAIDDMETGDYRISLVHPVRGVYTAPTLFHIDFAGTLKFGDYSRTWRPSWEIRREKPFVFEPISVIIWAVMVFSALALAVSIRGLGAALADGRNLRLDALAIVAGELMPGEKKQRIKKVKSRGISLAFKLAFFTILLVMTVVVMVSVPLYITMTRTQEETLISGLWERSSVLLEGLSYSAKAYLPSQNILELGFLPAQKQALPEAGYVTITGFGDGSAIFDDHVWASNDPDILSKINTEALEPGVSRLHDQISEKVEALAQQKDEEARAAVGAISASIVELTREAVSIAARTDSLDRVNEIQLSLNTLENRLNEGLNQISTEIQSDPPFPRSGLSLDIPQDYILYKPVLYRQGSEDAFFRGLIRLEVSITPIVEAIAERQEAIIRLILMVAITAVVIGAVGGLVFSSLISRPIRRLVSHVEVIRDTEDKSRLAGLDITINTRDEIATLGDTINDMTSGLVKAALASQDLTIGKEVQKKFIPLETDREGNKLTAGFKDTKNARFFGYYEGAKGVSGDYFDYLDLDGRYYAIIKCDVAGKGIPAALIMIQVATMFLSYFKSWKPGDKGFHIEEAVYQINDFIETLGFKGRFAAFTLALFDSQTGLLRFCNAGDNIVHWYDASSGRVKTQSLPQTPAAGVLPNFMVESKGGYTVQTMTLDRGDALFLYTDGIEEAKRKFRDRNFDPILCTEGEKDSPHENHLAGQDGEEMGPDRVEAIINAVMNRQKFVLHKHHNPEGAPGAGLVFDFSACEGLVDEAVLALVSVEKIFRMYKNPAAGEDARVLVDKKVDEFLREHFLQYRIYCSQTREAPASGYMYYTHVQEDEQYDDLTIVAVRRK